MDVSTTRQNIADELGNIDGLRVYPTIPDQVNGPTAVIYPNDFLYHQTYDGAESPQMIVQLLYPMTNAAGAQDTFDGWIGTGTTDSVVDAIEGTGVFRVVELRNYGVILLGDQASRYLSAELVVEGLV